MAALRVSGTAMMVSGAGAAAWVYSVMRSRSAAARGVVSRA
ncbi:Uncharacterised protein [Bordetella pertussis]|nr:Uncharacterised protein [Bordetella pertussis]CFV95342.1 Uncharacterised protein [Bordetella pertussis]CFW46191.1 Uncharacterised protein [Bordetella pertussis]CRE31862.1 Uncharacterised protein [Bordetella pertussis]